MAYWLTHLRIADKLLDKLDIPSPTHFLVGNIAPDSGELVPGTTATYVPTSAVSHWRDFENLPNAKLFGEKYFSTQHNPETISFYLGYYAHLVADYYFHRDIIKPMREKFADEYETDKNAFIWATRKNQTNLEYLYLTENPNMHAWHAFREITAFPNTYLDYFSETAIEKRVAFIIKYYENYPAFSEREFKYINKKDVDNFVNVAVDIIAKNIKET